MPTVPRVVVFDLGKVLLEFDFSIAIRRLQPRTRLSLVELHRLINQSTLLHRYETGLLDSAQFFAEFQAASGFAGDLAEFGAQFADIFHEIPDMVALHAEIRARGFPTYLFSNTNELAIRHIRATYPFFRRFDGYILSYEQRVMKPAPGLYEALERAAGRRGAEVFYLDDRADLVEAARARGWQAFVHQTPARSRAICADAGLLGPRTGEVPA